MRRRLTFDANPKELASRHDGTLWISLLWSRRKHRAAVVVEDDATGEAVELDVCERENALDVYQPDGVRPLVAEGQTAIAGETIIADLKAGDPQRSFRVG